MSGAGGKLTNNQREVLTTLEWANHKSRYPQEWCTPLDLGGFNGSHHSNTLAALAKKGLVQFKQRGALDPSDWESRRKIWRGRGSKCYRITPDGRVALASIPPSRAG